MKKKVVIQGVPKSSKKKVVIQGLPKAGAGDQININPQKGNYQWGFSSLDADSSFKNAPESLQSSNIQMPDYQIEQNATLTPSAPLTPGMGEPYKNTKTSKTTKPNVNWDFSKSNFGLFPLSGGKYAQRGFNYLNQIPGQVENAVSVFKTGKPTEKKQYPIYNPYVNAYWNYAEGGYLPKAQWGDEWGTSPGFGATQQSYSSAPENLQPVNVPMADYQTEQNATITPSVPELNEGMQQINFGESPDKKQKALKTIQKIGAVAAPVASTVLAGYNFAKQGLSDMGSNIANRKAQQAENQLYTQFSDAMNIPDYEEQGYGFTGRNALAADGMQIKQIGGMGEPNVEVEGEEHIQLPNGFSQEIQGKKHSEGGIPINLPQGTKIFSEKLKVPVSFLKEAIALDPKNQMLKSLKLPKTGKVSYADLAKKFETKKYVDLLNSKDADAIQMTTAQLMIQQNNAKLEELFGLQEQNKISGVHGPQVQQNAQQEQQEQEAQQAQMQGEQMEQPMMKYGGYLPKAQAGKEVTLPNGKKVTAVKVKEPGKEYKAVPNMPGYYYKTTTTTTPGKDITTTVTSKAPGKGSAEFNKAFADARKAGLKEFTWNGKKYTTNIYKPTTETITTPGQPTVTEAEDYVYIEPEQKPRTPPAPQVVNQTYEVPGLNLGIALPNVYERLPLNYYKIEPEYIDPRYLDIQPQLNRIGRGQRAIESTLGSRGSSDMANLLQAQANRSAAEQEAYGQKYNYDRAQDAAAQQFNAQAKMNANQYNQQSWFQQLEDPIRRRESLIGTQQMMDDQAAIENARKMQAFYGNKDYIDQTFNPYQKMTMQDLLGNLDAGKFFKQYQTDAVKESKAKTDEDKTTEVKKYGGKIKKKIKIKPKFKNSYF
jgi:hypothetical protein